MPAKRSTWALAILISILLMAGAGTAQQLPDPTKIALDAASLPTGSPRHPYKFQFQAHGGIPPREVRNC